MSEILIVFLSIIIGYFTGIATGLFGIGGGVIYVPALFILLAGINVPSEELPYIVIATSLFAGSFGSTGAFINHYKADNLKKRPALLLAAGSIISALLVPHFVVSIDPEVLKIILCSILLAVAIRMFWKENDLDSRIKLNEYFFIPFGLLVGIVSTITGLGGGILFVPIMVYLFGIKIKSAIGSSTLVVALTMIFSSLSYAFINSGMDYYNYQFGYINLLTGLPLGFGALWGSKYGVKLVFINNPLVIKRLFSVLLIIIIIKILFSL